MQQLNTIEFSDFTKLGNILFIKGVNSTKNEMLNSGLVVRMNIDEHTGNTREFTEVDTNEYLSYKAQGAQAAAGIVQQGYTKTMTKYRIAENMAITYEMRTENKYPEVVKELTNGGSKGYKTIDLDLSHRITFGTATSYTDRVGRTISIDCGDDFQLFYSAHTLKGSATTYRNRLANNPRLSKGALEGMERLVTEETYNQLGEAKKGVSFDILFTTDDPNTVNTAMEYLKSVAAPEGTNSGVTNVYQAKYKHVILPRVATTAAGATDSDKRYYWGIASSELSSFYFGMWEAPHMMSPQGNGGIDIQTDDWVYPVRAGYGITTVGANFIKFSSGTSEV